MKVLGEETKQHANFSQRRWIGWDTSFPKLRLIAKYPKPKQSWSLIHQKHWDILGHFLGKFVPIAASVTLKLRPLLKENRKKNDKIPNYRQKKINGQKRRQYIWKIYNCRCEHLKCKLL